MSTSKFPHFTEFNIPTSTSPPVTIHGLTAGNGPPLLLLHGYPQTHHIWHNLTPHLTSTYTVILLDLRGYGASSKPPSSPPHTLYAKSTMARDCLTVMNALGFDSFFICAHDRGARVAHKLMVDHPSAVKKAILLDVAPTAAMYKQTSFDFARAYYHWFFLIQPAPFPEALISANPDAFMDAHMSPGRKAGEVSVFDEECVGVYRAVMRDPAAVHAQCEDYRAGAGVDLEEAEEDEREGRRVRCEVMVLWGRRGVIEMCFDAVGEWGKVSDREVVGEGVDCGHYIPEEAPGVVLESIRGFLRQ